MDLERKSSTLESVGDNEVNQESFPCHDENEIQNNGSFTNEIDKLDSGENLNADSFTPTRKVEDVGFVSGEPVNSPTVRSNSSGSGDGGGSTPITKGYGLKKWRRIRRGIAKDEDTFVVDTSKILKRGLSGSANSPKFPLEVKQNSQGSIGSANLFKNVGSVDVFPIHGSTSESTFAVGSAFAAGTDSENSEDQSSKSSTAASAPKLTYDLPVVMRSVWEKSRMRNTSAKSLGNSTQRSQLGKGQTESSKKPRGERVKIEKENSYSSMESDSRSSNFVQGVFTVTSNGNHSGRSMNRDRENSDKVHTNEQYFFEEVQDGYLKDHMGDENVSQEDIAANLSWNAKIQENEDHQSLSDLDPFLESIRSLQFVQEALEQEVQKFVEIGNEPVSPDDDSINSNSVAADVSPTDPGFDESYLSGHFGNENIEQTAAHSLEVQVTENLKNLESKLEEARAMFAVKDNRVAELEGVIKSGKFVKEVSSSPRLEEQNNGAIETELEDLFKQKIEAEVEYLTIIQGTQNLKVAAGVQLTLLEEQENLAGEQAQMRNKLEETESKALMLKKQAEELEKYHADILGIEEAFNMQRRICKADCMGIVVNRLSSHPLIKLRND
ncbi:WPP domain-interacting protein [Quillaja saponaria]|uniref:WPP domain-interacting protein n=1 Tax=Quillaja saponaria TaxID=32244 RepID=A0AAD7LMT7_QUISA|nr:WPP domain-interacting protein [Quillaja saponaria]